MVGLHLALKVVIAVGLSTSRQGVFPIACFLP
jgi:hypothetical protein